MRYHLKSITMSKTNNFVFTGLKIIAWIIFVGLCIEAVGLLVNFFFSIYNPGFVKNLYQKLDLSALYNNSKMVFFGMYGFVLTVALLKAWLFYMVIILVTKLDLSRPFSSFTAQKISQLSYFTFSIGIISHIAKEVAKNMSHHGLETESLNQFWADSQAFIIMSAVIFVIAQIFAKGVEIQSENDLTV